MARTNKELITDLEIKAFKTWANNEGVELTKENLTVVGDFIAGRMNADIDKDTLAAAYQYIKPQLKFISQALLTLSAANLSKAEDDVFTKWFAKQSRLENADGDEKALENCANLIQWCRNHSRDITEQNLSVALSNLVNNAKVRLHFKPAPTTFEGGRHSGKVFNDRDRTNQGVVNTINHADDPRFNGEADRVEVKEQLSADDLRWKSLAESIRGHHHSVNAELDQTFGKDWRQTYELRQAIIRRSERVGR